MLILCGEVGYMMVDLCQQILQDYLFCIGGIGSVCGYVYQSFGIKEGVVIVGGCYMVLGSIEVIYWFNESWGIVVFVDVGDVVDDFNKVKFVIGVGVGVCWCSLVGLIGVDFVYGECIGEIQLYFLLVIFF